MLTFRWKIESALLATLSCLQNYRKRKVQRGHWFVKGQHMWKWTQIKD